MGTEKKIKFEEALKRLDAIVSALESGDLPLDESLRLFEEGTKLVKLAGEQLGAAERKMRLLTKDGDGNVTGSEEMEDLAPVPGGAPPDADA